MYWTPERKVFWAKRLLRYAALVCLVAWPWYGDTFVLLGDANLALTYAVIAASLVLLTGWVGQISLAQASFVGIGAFTTALVARGLHLGFPLSLVVGGLAAAGAAAAMGVVALRVRGLYLAVATLIFAWMCDTYLFLAPWLTRGGGAVQVESLPVGVPETFPYFDFLNRRTFYYVALAVAALVIFALSNLRDSKTGRAFFAVKGSEVAAASLGIDVTRYKLLAFALSGFVAGMAGNLIAIHQGALTPTQFRFTISFFYLAIPVVGGLLSLWGAVAASAFFGALSNFFFRTPSLNGYLEIVSATMLMAVLLGYPGGLADVPRGLRNLLNRVWPLVRDALSWARPDRGILEAETVQEVPGGRQVETANDRGPDSERPSALGRLAGRIGIGKTVAPADAVDRNGSGAEHLLSLDALGVFDDRDELAADDGESEAPDDDSEMSTASPWATREWTNEFVTTRDRSRRPTVLEASGVTVRFGGLTAVDDVSLDVREHEIVGLIGPNGAGKTTLFNAIAGLNRPTSGTVSIFECDATELPVHARAQLGVGRTFQAIQLLTDLTTYQNLLVATHLQTHTGFLSHVAVTRSALEAEDRARALVDGVIEIMGLEDVADRNVADLPFGTLRMIEVARALVTRSPLIMLDEPASGLDNAETADLSQLLLWLRADLGVSILLIEHDVHMVTSISDHMFVIDRGRLIATGAPADVQSDSRVIAAYLGGGDDEEEADSESEVRSTASDGELVAR